MEIVGITPLITPLPSKRDVRYRYPDPWFTRVPRNIRKQIASSAGDFYRALPHQASYYKSIKKMDVGRDVGYKAHPYWRLAKEYVNGIYYNQFTQYTRKLTTEEIYADMNLSKSPGLPWTKLGFRTKMDCVNSNLYLEHRLRHFDERVPVWTAVGKVEWLHISDLVEDKIRTFIIPPIDFLEDQKRFYQCQNRAMKMFHWSSYGFNPYSGGVNRLAQRLLRNPIFMTYDVRGWDRVLQVMRTVYSMRNTYLPPEDEDWWSWVTEHSVRAYILLANGLLIRREVGNNSGSNNTTTDNILAHTFILAFVMFLLYDGDEKMVDQVIACLFGDDDVGSLPYTDKNVEEVLTEGFKLFKMELDPIRVATSLEGLEFLGFKFHRIPQGWIPVYNYERICASFAFVYEKLPSESAYISKAWSLCVMSAGNGRDAFAPLCDAVNWILSECRGSSDPVIKSYLEVGAPTYDECISFFLGFETSPLTQYFASEALTMVDGRYKEFLDEQPTAQNDCASVLFGRIV